MTEDLLHLRAAGQNGKNHSIYPRLRHMRRTKVINLCLDYADKNSLTCVATSGWFASEVIEGKLFHGIARLSAAGQMLQMAA